MDALARHRAPAVMAIAAVLLFALSGVASAYTSAPGYAANDYATGFPESPTNHWGPIGLAFDQSDNLYVADAYDDNIYRFQPGGGVASAATRLTQSPIPGKIAGLAISSSGDLYLARWQSVSGGSDQDGDDSGDTSSGQTGDVVQVDPETGGVLRTIADVPCATGLAIDPVSGDLFVSENQCGSTIWRVSGFASGPGTVTAYAHLRGVDGLAFASDGTLYAESDGAITKIDGTNTATPGLATSLGTVPTADGVAIGAPVAGQPPFLAVNRNDGIVTRVNINQGSASETNIFSGGSRGDFVAVDSYGCLYITQSASVVRITGEGRSCAFEPSTPAASGPGLRPALIATSLRHAAHKTAACTLLQSLKIRLSQQGRVRLKSATIYVNGKQVKKVKGAKVTAPIVLSKLPKTSFTLKVVALTTKGKKLVTTKHYANCAKPAAPACVNTSSLKVPVPQPRGSRVVAVEVYVNGHRKKVVRGHRLTKVTLKGLPHGRFTVKLLTRDARGGHATKTQTFTGCAASAKHKASAKDAASAEPKAPTGTDSPSSCDMAVPIVCVIAAKE